MAIIVIEDLCLQIISTHYLLLTTRMPSHLGAGFAGLHWWGQPIAFWSSHVAQWAVHDIVDSYDAHEKND